jgi:hypothetical protein
VWIALGVVGVVVATVAGLFAWRWSERGPDEASLGGAVERFRSSSTVPAPVIALRPPAGVYTYTGQGREKLSFLSTSQSQGPQLPGTVTPAAGDCWTFAIEYNEFHSQEWNWCVRDGKLVERGGTTRQRFDFVAFKVDETSRFTCDPALTVIDPQAEPGASWPTRCVGTSERTSTTVYSEGTTRFVGRETLDVGGTPVEALHYRSDRTLRGDQTGEEHNDTWFAASDGRVLRNARDIEVVSPAPAPLDSVTYTEQGDYRLASMAPRR